MLLIWYGSIIIYLGQKNNNQFSKDSRADVSWNRTSDPSVFKTTEIYVFPLLLFEIKAKQEPAALVVPVKVDNVAGAWLVAVVLP